MDSLYDAFIAYYTENIAVDSQPFPGTLELLDRLEAAGVKLGICTNKQERLSLRLMDRLGLTQRFGAIIGADTIGISKPDPAPYREAVARLGATGGGSVMIGDSETDILTARAAGVPVIAVTFGYTDRHVAEFNPDHTVDHMQHVWPVIAGYLEPGRQMPPKP
jgi:phosphoglycolate phosphatase